MDREPTYPTCTLDTTDLNATAAAGADIIREEIAEMEEEEEDERSQARGTGETGYR